MMEFPKEIDINRTESCNGNRCSIDFGRDDTLENYVVKGCENKFSNCINIFFQLSYSYINICTNYMTFNMSNCLKGTL